MKVYVSYSSVQCFVDKVAAYFNEEGIQLTGVFGIPRGGLVLAVMISHKMNIPLLMSPTEGCLIVDDICDSGESLVHYVKNTSSPNKPKYYTATMYYKDNELGIVPFIYDCIKGDDWIIFCWESSLEDARKEFPNEVIKVADDANMHHPQKG